METRDYSKRTSKSYDDRDGDVITRLDKGLIKVCEGEAPKMAFFMVMTPGKQVTDVDGVSNVSINMNVEAYARMAALPVDLRKLVSEALKASDASVQQIHGA